MRIWAWLLTIVMVVNLIIPYLSAPFHQQYSHRKMVMSYLGNPESPVRIVYNCWLVLGGLVFLWGSVSFFGYYRDRGGPLTAILILMLMYGIGGMVLSGIFSVGQTKEMATPSAKIHGYGSTFGFIALLFVPLLLAIATGRQGDTPSIIICTASFLSALFTFVLFIMADKPQFHSTIIADEGTWQRITLFLCTVQLCISALRINSMPAQFILIFNPTKNFRTSTGAFPK